MSLKKLGRGEEIGSLDETRDNRLWRREPRLGWYAYRLLKGCLRPSIREDKGVRSFAFYVGVISKTFNLQRGVKVIG